MSCRLLSCRQYVQTVSYIIYILPRKWSVFFSFSGLVRISHIKKVCCLRDYQKYWTVLCIRYLRLSLGLYLELSQTIVIFFFFLSNAHRREAGVSDVFPLSGISLRAVSLIPLVYISPLLFFCLVLLLFLSYPFFCFWPIPMTSFPLNLHFPKGRFLFGSCQLWFEQLGDEYFSWWYVQHNLCCHMALVLAFVHWYSIFNLQLFLSILVWKRQTEVVNDTSIS